jgi:hypothetical protein
VTSHQAFISFTLGADENIILPNSAEIDTVVPERSTLLLLGTGLVGLATYARCRKSADNARRTLRARRSGCLTVNFGWPVNLSPISQGPEIATCAGFEGSEKSRGRGGSRGISPRLCQWLKCGLVSVSRV